MQLDCGQHREQREQAPITNPPDTARSFFVCTASDIPPHSIHLPWGELRGQLSAFLLAGGLLLLEGVVEGGPVFGSPLITHLHSSWPGISFNRIKGKGGGFLYSECRSLLITLLHLF